MARSASLCTLTSIAFLLWLTIRTSLLLDGTAFSVMYIPWISSIFHLLFESELHVQLYNLLDQTCLRISPQQDVDISTFLQLLQSRHVSDRPEAIDVVSDECPNNLAAQHTKNLRSYDNHAS